MLGRFPCDWLADETTNGRQFIVMFRSRFNECFPKSLSHYGPQDIENGVVSTVPGEHVENLLCALIALVLNRKKWVEYDHPSWRIS